MCSLTDFVLFIRDDKLDCCFDLGRSWILFSPGLLKADLFPAALDQDLTERGGVGRMPRAPSVLELIVAL